MENRKTPDLRFKEAKTIDSVIDLKDRESPIETIEAIPTKVVNPARSILVGLAEGSVYPSDLYPALTSEEEQVSLRAAIPALLRDAQKMKWHKQQDEIAALKREKAAKMSEPPKTPKDFLNEIITERGPQLASDQFWPSPFALTVHNKHIYETLALYFMGDKRFETFGCDFMKVERGSFSMNKGICLIGPTGVGKTDILKLFSRNPYAPFTFLKTSELETDYARKETGGPILINKYSNHLPCQNPQNYYGHTSLGFGFDDFGAETGEASFMGSKIDLIDTLIRNRYDNTRGPWNLITTNGSEKQMEDTIDGRAWDRMKQMFNFIAFADDAPSLRK